MNSKWNKSTSWIYFFSPKIDVSTPCYKTLWALLLVERSYLFPTLGLPNTLRTVLNKRWTMKDFYRWVHLWFEEMFQPFRVMEQFLMWCFGNTKNRNINPKINCQQNCSEPTGCTKKVFSSLSGGSLPCAPRGGEWPHYRAQTEDSLWETQLGQRVYQYYIKSPKVSPLTFITLQTANEGRASAAV